MNYAEIKKEITIKAMVVAAIIGTILNLTLNNLYLPMLWGSMPFSWLGFGKILIPYVVPFVVALYTQQSLIPIYLALLNLKNPFYIINSKNLVKLISNKLIDELNANYTNEGSKPCSYCDIVGMNIKDLSAMFGFFEYERKELMANFSKYGEVDGPHQILGKRVNGKRYGYICSSNQALDSNCSMPSQGMFLRRDDLTQKDRSMVMMLAKAAENKDKNTGEHIMRMRHCSLAVGQTLGLSEDDLEILDFGSILHDVGKIAIADEILNKPGEFNPHEWEIMKTHASKGGEILRNGNDPFFAKVALIPDQHHENYDGTGYPKGLEGEEIDLLARVVAVADTFDALSTKRPYKEKLSRQEVFKKMEAQRGKKFDPFTLDAFYQCLIDNKIPWRDFLEGRY